LTSSLITRETAASETTRPTTESQNNTGSDVSKVQASQPLPFGKSPALPTSTQERREENKAEPEEASQPTKYNPDFFKQMLLSRFKNKAQAKPNSIIKSAT